MRPGAAPGAAEEPDLLARGEALAERDGDAVKMGIARDDARAVVDFDDLAVFVLDPGEDDDAGGRVVDRRFEGRGEIEPGMHRLPMVEGIDARTESALELILRERCRQGERPQHLAHPLGEAGTLLDRPERNEGAALPRRHRAVARRELVEIDPGRGEDAHQLAPTAPRLVFEIAEAGGAGAGRTALICERRLGEGKLLRLLRFEARGLESGKLAGEAAALDEQLLVLGRHLPQLPLRGFGGSLRLRRLRARRLQLGRELVDAARQAGALLLGLL